MPDLRKGRSEEMVVWQAICAYPTSVLVEELRARIEQDRVQLGDLYILESAIANAIPRMEAKTAAELEKLESSRKAWAWPDSREGSNRKPRPGRS